MRPIHRLRSASMKVFIGWSGELSGKVGSALYDWLPQVIQAVKPFISKEDVAKGARWSSTIEVTLKESAFGIMCLTKANQRDPWINFETGALSNAMGVEHVCPLLFDFGPTELTGPLSQFQGTLSTDEADILRLVKTVNTAAEKLGVGLADGVLNAAFKRCWPELASAFDAIRKASAEPPTKPRSEREMLEEILQLIRNMSAASAPRTTDDFFAAVGRASGRATARGAGGSLLSEPAAAAVQAGQPATALNSDETNKLIAAWLAQIKTKK
jgi:hypothetical protein